MDRYHTTYSWDGNGSLSGTIVEAIAAVSEREPTEVEDSFQTAVDPDALDHLVESLRESTHRDGDGRINLTCDGHRVTVLASGDITVRRHTTESTRDAVTNDEEFQVTLMRLIREAEANGVDVEGGWACQDTSDPEWGIEIYEVKS